MIYKISEGVRRHTYAFALAVMCGLLIANIVVLPEFADLSSIQTSLGVLAPLVLVAMASTPSILSGGVDVSVALTMGFTNMILVVVLEPHGLGGPAASIPILLAIGAAIGTVNGLAVCWLRFPPVIATLCMYFILDGITHSQLPVPASSKDNWTEHLAARLLGIPGGIWSIGLPLAAWLLLKRTPYYKALFSVGGDDATAYSAGVNVAAVRTIAYALGGVFAAVAGMAVTGLLDVADPNVPASYILLAIAAVALGGTPLGGGRGGMAGSLIGATVIFLIESLLSSAQVNSNWLQVISGLLLAGSVVLSARIFTASTLEA
jgi:ribose transport system permease protein